MKKEKIQALEFTGIFGIVLSVVMLALFNFGVNLNSVTKTAFQMAGNDYYGNVPNAGIDVDSGLLKYDNGDGQNTVGFEALKNFFTNPEQGIFHFAKIIIGIIACVFIIVLVSKILTAAGDESTIQKNRTALLWVIAGFLSVMLADKIPAVFNLSTEKTFMSDPSNTIVKFQDAAYYPLFDFVKNFLGAVSIFFMVISGWNMISAQGNDDIYQKNRTRLIISIVAFAVIIMAEPLITEFLNKGYEKGEPVLNQIRGIEIITHFINFILTISGTLAVAFLMLGGFYYIVNIHDEKTAEKGKHIVISTIIALAIIYSASVVVNFAIGGEAGSYSAGNQIEVNF